MRPIALAAVAVVLAGTACSDRVPTAALSPTLEAPAGIAAAALAPSPTGGFAPLSADRILFDARQSIQRATGVWYAVSGIAPGASSTGTWTFTQNVDGAGTRALRLDVQPGSSTCRRVTNAIDVPLPQPYPTRLVFQWKQRLGRTSTGGGEAAVGTFALGDACGGIDRTQVRAYRDTSAANAGRIETQWVGNGLSSQAQRFNPSATLATVDRAALDLRQLVGRTATHTLFLQAESAPGKSDGVLRLWVDGRLVKEVTGAAVGTQAFRRLNFPGSIALPRMPQSEYWWDLVAWVPAGDVTPPPSDTTGGTPPADTVIARIVLDAASASIAVGQTAQLRATALNAAGDTLAKSIGWSSSANPVATVSAQGLVKGVSAGSASIRAIAENDTATAVVTVTAAAPVPVPPTGGSIVDPLLLPKATGQRPLAGSYGRSVAAGQTYVDPNTQVTVLKVTGPSTPVANAGMYHGYSEGGPSISQPWTGADGSTYYTLWLAWGQGWFVDVKYPQLTLANWRAAPVSNEGEGAWSLNPATPRVFYYSGGNTLNRYDTQGNRVANTTGFPFSIPSTTGSNFSWLQTQVNDTWFVGMTTSNNTVVAYRPADGTTRTITRAATGLDIDEPHIDREQPVVYLSAGSSDPQNVIYNLNTNTRINPRDTQGIVNDDHNAPMRGKIVGVSWQANATVAVDWQGNVTKLPGGSPTDWAGDFHAAGQWMFGNPSEYWAVDQWQRAGSYPVYLGMIGLMSTNGDIRLLAAHDGTGGGYQSGGQPHPTFAPDGKLLMWTSNMNGSGRYDVFLAKLPTR